MKIAYLTGEYPRATDTFIQREIKVLRELGIDVQTFAVRRSGDEHMVGPEQVAERDRTLYLLPPNLFILLKSHIQLLLGNPRRYLQAIGLAQSTTPPGLRSLVYQLFYFAEAGLLARSILRQNIQHLHNHLADSSCTVAMLAAKLGGFSFSFTIHGPAIFFEPYRWRIDQKIKQARFVCCISHFCRSQCMFFVPPEYWSRLHIIHCGIEPDSFERVEHQTNSKSLLYVGRLAAAKGLPILLKSIAILKQEHPEIQLTVIGDGPDRQVLEQQAINVNVSKNIQFVGYQSQARVREYLQQTDIFVLPSFAEGVPVSLMEAMAVGVPVVTTQIAGISELVTQGISGFLVPPGDVAALGDRIQQLLINPELRKTLGLNGRLKVETEFNLHLEVAELKRLFESSIHSL